MKTTIYANYGVLGAEKQVVYSTHRQMSAALSERVDVILENALRPYVARSGYICIDPEGANGPYELNEVLDEIDGQPAVTYYAENTLKEISVQLKIAEELN